jgi:predicted methyltransferase
MLRSVLAGALVALACAGPATASRGPLAADRQPQTANRERQTPAQIAAASENPSTAAWRYRTAIAGLMQLKPGMVAAEFGPGSAYLARTIAARVAPDGRAIAAVLDPAMAAFVAERAKGEGIRNLSTVVVRPDGSGLEPASLDAAAIVNALGSLPRQQDIVTAIGAALKPGGVLVVVDLPAESIGSKVIGLDADDVVKLAAAAGLEREAESTVVPGQYAIRFRKP